MAQDVNLVVLPRYTFTFGAITSQCIKGIFTRTSNMAVIR